MLYMLEKEFQILLSEGALLVGVWLIVGGFQEVRTDKIPSIPSTEALLNILYISI